MGLWLFPQEHRAAAREAGRLIYLRLKSGDDSLTAFLFSHRSLYVFLLISVCLVSNTQTQVRSAVFVRTLQER